MAKHTTKASSAILWKTYNQCKKHHLVAKFTTNASSVIWFWLKSIRNTFGLWTHTLSLLCLWKCFWRMASLQRLIFSFCWRLQCSQKFWKILPQNLVKFWVGTKSINAQLRQNYNCARIHIFIGCRCTWGPIYGSWCLLTQTCFWNSTDVTLADKRYQLNTNW